VLCSLAVEFLILGGIPQIQRANADEFIHIFVNNSKKLTEFLEHMVKVCIFIFFLQICHWNFCVCIL